MTTFAACVLFAYLIFLIRVTSAHVNSLVCLSLVLAISTQSIAQTITLAEQTAISDDEAKDLSLTPWDRLFATKTTDISDTAAALLAKHQGELYLSGLQTLSPEAAKALGRHEGLLEVGGKELSDDVIASLAQCRGPLSLKQLQSLTPPAAELLAKHHQGDLFLNAVKALSPAAAEAIAAHRGKVALLGVEVLNDESAAAIAKAQYIIHLSDREEFTETTRTILSGHHGCICLGLLDLPQYFPVDDGWLAESKSGIEDRNATRLIEAAIENALSPESEGRGPLSLSGVRVGSRLRDLCGPDYVPFAFEFVPTRLLITPPDGQTDHKVCVYADSLTGKVIGVEKIIAETSLAQVSNEVATKYGKTPQEIVERLVRRRDATIKRHYVRYTFPSELVRVQEVRTFPNRGPAQVNIAAYHFSRDWVEDNLRSYGNVVLKACDWARTAMDTYDGDNFDLSAIPPLPGTEKELRLENTHVLFNDIHSMKLAKNDVIRRTYQVMGLSLAVHPMVAAVGKVDGMPVIVMQPFNSTVAGFRCLAATDQLISQGTHNILETSLQDLLHEVASSLAQYAFPPEAGKIDVIRERNLTWEAQGGRGGVAELNNIYDSISHFSRHEWAFGNGWFIRISDGGNGFCFYRPERKRNLID